MTFVQGFLWKTIKILSTWLIMFGIFNSYYSFLYICLTISSAMENLFPCFVLFFWVGWGVNTFISLYSVANLNSSLSQFWKQDRTTKTIKMITLEVEHGKKSNPSPFIWSVHFELAKDWVGQAIMVTTKFNNVNKSLLDHDLFQN